MEQRNCVMTIVAIFLFQFFNTTLSSKVCVSQSDYEPTIKQFLGKVLLSNELLPIDIDTVICDNNKTCQNVLPDLHLALTMDSNLPSEPYCLNVANLETTTTEFSNSSGHCTCGPGKCVSYTMKFGKNRPFYYCGPCSHMGAQCENGTCAHEMADCKTGYCQCKQNGEFYEFNYCEVPYMAYETSLQVCIIICIAIVLLLLFSSIYKASGIRSCWRNTRDSESSPRLPMSEDLPPNYEEVMDYLPTYQDALQMVHEENGDSSSDNTSERNSEGNNSEGNNSEGNPTPPPPYEAQPSEAMTTTLTLERRTSVEENNDDGTNNTATAAACNIHNVNYEIPCTRCSKEQGPSRLTLHNRSLSLPDVHDPLICLSHQPIEMPLREALYIQTHC